MGAWGNGPFENDGALDLVGDLGASKRPLADDLRRVLDRGGVPRPSRLARLLRRQPDDGPDGVDDFAVVAAAGIVAAALGLDVGDAQVTELLAKKPLAVSADLRTAARAALARATRSGSEWFELWQESGELDQTQTETDRIRRIL
jgi:hypothetical protein